MARVGKNILENLTTGMYSDSKVCFREYIQNACDQIDIAISEKLLNRNEACVDIEIDPENRKITIYDNATGVSSEEFVDNLGDVANSRKVQGERKGFRGIGRLCGLAYCRTLQFTTSFQGEDTASVMICDAKKMREMIGDKHRYSLDEVWDAIVEFKQIDGQPVGDHYFKVEMIDINKENHDLLDEKKVRDYLSFVAPVPYKSTCIFRNKILNFAKQNGFQIDEYVIKVNGQQLFKPYSSSLQDKSGKELVEYDKIKDVEFKILTDEDNKAIGWLWFGICMFKKSIPVCNAMRCLRLRSANIQIGGLDTLRDFFQEPRGNGYFVGEVFATDTNLIPNSQRDYFNETPTRTQFEKAFRTYCFDVLTPLYNSASKVNSAFRAQTEFETKKAEFHEKDSTSSFVDLNEKQKLQEELEVAEKKAAEAQKKIQKIKDTTDSTAPVAQVLQTIEEKYISQQQERAQEEAENPPKANTTDPQKKNKYLSSTLTKLNHREKQLMTRVMGIIVRNAPKEIAKAIIDEIKKEMS